MGTTSTTRRRSSADDVRARVARQDPEITALAQTFVVWAGQSGIAPEEIRELGKGIQHAWTIASIEVRRQEGYIPGANCTSGRCNHASCMGSLGVSVKVTSYLRIHTSGEVTWSERGFDGGKITINARHMERKIADYIVQSGSRVPWPSSPVV